MMLINLILTLSAAFACPTINGSFSCTSSKGDIDTVYISTEKIQGVTHYSIQNEDHFKPIKLIADGEFRVEKEVITNDHGKVIGVIVTQKKSQCRQSQQLSFERNSDVTYYNQKLKQGLSASVKVNSKHQLETTTSIYKIDDKGKKSVTQSHSLCTRL